MTDYIKQAEKFLKDTNTIMEIIYDGMYSPRWDNKLHCAYKIKLQNEKGKYNFTFFDSLHNTEIKKMSLSEYLKKYKRINNINDISYNEQQKYNKELTKLKKESQPTYYNVLACLEKYDVGTLDDFMLFCVVLVEGIRTRGGEVLGLYGLLYGYIVFLFCCII